jgi:hypothetical protein
LALGVKADQLLSRSVLAYSEFKVGDRGFDHHGKWMPVSVPSALPFFVINLKKKIKSQ